MKQKKMRLITIICAVIMCILFAEKMTGEVVHMVLGLIICLAGIFHVARNMDHIKHMPRGIKVVDYLMCLFLVIMLISGIMIHPLKFSGENMRLLMVCGISHVLGAVFFVILCIIHVIQHGILGRKNI